jgi:hypothetical protein
LREASTSLAPFLAAALAVASPIPLEAPVITITCSLSDFNLIAIVEKIYITDLKKYSR